MPGDDHQKASTGIRTMLRLCPPSPGLAIGMRREMSRLACAYSETTNLTGSVLLELNQELGGVHVVALQNLMTID